MLSPWIWWQEWTMFSVSYLYLIFLHNLTYRFISLKVVVFTSFCWRYQEISTNNICTRNQCKVKKKDEHGNCMVFKRQSVQSTFERVRKKKRKQKIVMKVKKGRGYSSPNIETYNIFKHLFL